jgi:hypothetical protein
MDMYKNGDKKRGRRSEVRSRKNPRCKLPTDLSLLFTAHGPLFIAYPLLPIAYCPLPGSKRPTAK